MAKKKEEKKEYLLIDPKGNGTNLYSKLELEKEIQDMRNDIIEIDDDLAKGIQDKEIRIFKIEKEIELEVREVKPEIICNL